GPSMDLLLIRHAEPVRVESAEGAADPELTGRGREQARRLAEWLADEAIDAVWASPLRRAIETATELARAHAVELVVDDELCEWDRDDPSYIPIEELRRLRDERWFALVEERWDELAPGLDPARFRAGVVGAVERVVATHPGEHVAVVCHGGVINAYLGHVLGISRHLWFEPRYASVSRVAASRDGARSVVSLNETAHLRGVL
ncbi:MAG TPA: histidine phosphatase family protein, partial [Solirubrobacteraceae bacterium]